MVDIAELTVGELAGTKAKTAACWKLTQVSGMETVAIVFIDPKTGDKLGHSSPVVAAGAYTDKVHGKMALFRTQSGSVYAMRMTAKEGSLWPTGIQIKRPLAYARLQELGVL